MGEDWNVAEISGKERLETAVGVAGKNVLEGKVDEAAVTFRDGSISPFFFP